MKTSLRDALIIATTLITILGSGYGLGRLAPRAPAPAAPTSEITSLEANILASLRQSLDLTPEQEEAIVPQLTSFADEVSESRRAALIRYYEGLIDFHETIAPSLNSRQQSILRANQKLLEAEYANRFHTES